MPVVREDEVDARKVRCSQVLAAHLKCGLRVLGLVQRAAIAQHGNRARGDEE